ncbi:MAG TPA: 2Fe-2S iron-sulfur cluster-binding protein [Chloroflexota bacterium]
MKIRYEDEEIEAQPGERLLDVILRSGADHRHICGGNGFCTSCRVEVVDHEQGLSSVSALEYQRLGAQSGKLRLACQAHVLGPVTVRVARATTSRFSLVSE